MLHFQRKGTGEPLVLIHGFLGTHQIFHKVIDELARSYDVIAIDLPGHGGTPIDEKLHTVDDYAKAIIKLLVSLDIKKATWIGHSFGGYIVYAAVEKYGKYLNKAAAVYSTPAADDPLSKKRRENSIQEIKDNGTYSFAVKRIPTYFADNADQKDIAYAIRLAKETSSEGAIKAIQAMHDRSDKTYLLGKVDIPLLILKGTKDKWDGIFYVITQSSFVTILETETSHMGMLDDPQAFLHALKEWLATASDC